MIGRYTLVLCVCVCGAQLVIGSARLPTLVVPAESVNHYPELPPQSKVQKKWSLDLIYDF